MKRILSHSLLILARAAQFAAQPKLTLLRRHAGVTGYRSECWPKSPFKPISSRASPRPSPPRSIPGVLHPTCALSPKSSSTSAWPTTTCTNSSARLSHRPRSESLEKSTTDKSQKSSPRSRILSPTPRKQITRQCPTPTSIQEHGLVGGKNTQRGILASSSSATPRATSDSRSPTPGVRRHRHTWTEDDAEETAGEKRQRPHKDKQ